MKFFKSAIPIIALVVTLSQVVMVYVYDISPWRGGGFGMYSRIHYNRYEVWVNNIEINYDSLHKNDGRYYYLTKKIRIKPGTENMLALGNYLSHKTAKDSVHIQVWAPQMDADKGIYTRKLINEVAYVRSE